MLSKPISGIFQAYPFEKETVRLLIHAHTAKVLTPFGDALIEQLKQFFLSAESIAFGMTLNNCAATFDALELAAYFLTNEDKTAKAIVVSGEKAFTPTVQVIPNTSITGDAAAACLISLSGKRHRLIAMHRFTEGAYSKGIWMDAADAKDFEKNYMSLLMKVVQTVLDQAGIKKNKIAWIIPHNVNLISWLRFAKDFNFPSNKIYLNNVSKYGHCFGSDIFINYADLLNQNLLNLGDYYLMVTVGLGATFAAALFQY
jgi:3-oxoacyl-[acyl-carrier-protein] synthase-3